MTGFDELLAAATAALRLPGSLLRPGWWVTREPLDGDTHAPFHGDTHAPFHGDTHAPFHGDTHAPFHGGDLPPVLLVHGYAGSAAVWDPLVGALRGAGFGYVARLSYNSLTCPVPELLAGIGAAAAEAVSTTGARGVHLVGHSLGGLLVRCAVQTGSLPVRALTATTIATPHAGSTLAPFALGPCARLLDPRSPLLAGLHRGDPSVRWTAFWSDADLVVPPPTARLDAAGLPGIDVAVPGRGHLTICRDPYLIARLVDALLDLEAAPRPALATAA